MSKYHKIISVIYLHVNHILLFISTVAKEICMKDLGCFAITDDFKSVKNRPINVLPHDRATINTKCMLYTKRNLKESHQLVASDKRTFDQSKFDPKDPTIFIIHGFMDRDLYGPWMSVSGGQF